jgi:hypothetical protein
MNIISRESIDANDDLDTKLAAVLDVPDKIFSNLRLHAAEYLTYVG